MKPADFRISPAAQNRRSADFAQEIGDDGKILAGGQSLMPMMNFRLAQPAHLIDINFIDGLDYIRSENGALKIGCLARQSRVLNDPLIRQRCPLLAAALTHVGYEQTRNRGTFCGSLAHADPAAELPAVLLASGRLITVGTTRTREYCCARIFRVLSDDGAMAATRWFSKLRFPSMPPQVGLFVCRVRARFGDFAIVGVAALLRSNKDQIADARIALTGVGDKPWRERELEAGPGRGKSLGRAF